MALRVTTRTDTSISVAWDSLGESGNIVTDPYYNLELWEPNDDYGVAVRRYYDISLNARSFTFTGLKSSTPYMAKLYANRQHDRKIERVHTGTLAPSVPAPSAPSMSVSVSGTTVTATGVAGSNTEYIQFEVNGQLAGVRYVSGGNSYTYSFTGAYNTTYTIVARPYNGAIQGPTVSRSVTTGSAPRLPAPTGFRIYAQTENTASFTWFAVSGANGYTLQIFRGSTKVAEAVGFTGNTRTIGGLLPDVDYIAYVYAYDSNGSGSSASLSFKLGYDRPQDFAWTTVKARGRSYNLANGRYTNLITRTEVVNLQTRINEFRRYKGLSPYSFTSPATGAVFTAALYNELNDAIAGMSPPSSVPGRKSSGTANLPALLNGLVTALNSI